MGTYLSSDDLPGMDVTTADELIAELEAHLSLHYPYITPSLAPGKLAKLKAMLVPVVRRWEDGGTGLSTQEITGPFSERRSGGGGHVLWAHEKNNLRVLCGLSTGPATSRGGFPPPEPIGGLFVRRPGWPAV